MDKTLTNWQDIVNFLLGFALFTSPFVLGYSAEQTPAWNAYLVGAIIAILALATIFAFNAWEELANAALGAWLVISPWIMGFSGHATATNTHVVIGIATLVLALWAMREHDTEHHLPAGR